MTLSIIIVSYNTKDILKECLGALEKFPPKSEFEVIVVDNASSDKSAEMVEKEFPKVHLFKNEKNEGFSKANNIGVRKSKGEFVLFLNSDAIVREKTLDEMTLFMEGNKKAGAATCKVELLSGKIDDASHRGFPTPWNSFSHFLGLAKLFPHSKLFSGYSLGHLDLKVVHEIDALAGAFMIVRRSAGEDVGWWDEDYFWYGEDIDFCYKLKQKDWEIFYVPTVSVLHYKGVSGGIKKDSQNMSTASSETQKRAQKARFSAMRIFYKKHYEKKYPSILTWLVYKGIDFKQLSS